MDTFESAALENLRKRPDPERSSDVKVRFDQEDGATRDERPCSEVPIEKDERGAAAR